MCNRSQSHRSPHLPGWSHCWHRWQQGWGDCRLLVEGDLREGKGERLEKLRAFTEAWTFCSGPDSSWKCHRAAAKSTELLPLVHSSNLLTKKHTVKPLAAPGDNALCPSAQSDWPFLSGSSKTMPPGLWSTWSKADPKFEVSNFCLRAAAVSAGFNVKGSCEKSPQKHTSLTLDSHKQTGQLSSWKSLDYSKSEILKFVFWHFLFLTEATRLEKSFKYH